MVGWEDLASATKRYVAEFNAFLDHHHEVRRVVRSGVRLDHAAIKAENASVFDTYAGHVQQFGEYVGTVSESGRRVSLYELLSPLRTSIGTIDRVELMEPRPGVHGPSEFRLDHIEYSCPELRSIKAAARKDKVRFEPEHDSLYRWVAIRFGREQEVRFANASSAELLTKRQL
jgi:predicted metalloenzyme YecM